jgi:hypothetical protein
MREEIDIEWECSNNNGEMVIDYIKNSEKPYAIWWDEKNEIYYNEACILYMYEYLFNNNEEHIIQLSQIPINCFSIIENIYINNTLHHVIEKLKNTNRKVIGSKHFPNFIYLGNYEEILIKLQEKISLYFKSINLIE